MRPWKRLAGLLSTHIDSWSSRLPLCAHAPVVQVTPSGEVHRPIASPPQPVAKSPANHMPKCALYTTIGPPKLVPWPEQKGWSAVHVLPLSVEYERPL